MSLRDEISQLIQNKIVIRHRAPDEKSGNTSRCIICRRNIILPPGALCLALGDEGLVCRVCGNTYAPEMNLALGKQLPITHEQEKPGPPTLSDKWDMVTDEFDALIAITDELSKGIARGIVEAPAGHIGMMHYAKNIQKLEKKPGESEKDYNLRVRTHRMTRLYEIIRRDTAGRIEALQTKLSENIARNQ